MKKTNLINYLIIIVAIVATLYAISIANIILATVIIAFIFGVTLKNVIDQLIK